MNRPDELPVATQVSCADPFDPASLQADDARRRMLDAVTPVAGVERVALRSALGRVLAQDVQSRLNVPAHTNSAMDGYAVFGDDVADEGIKTLTVVGSAFAGRPYAGTVAAGECVRIMTGAVMPGKTDTIVIQEQVEQHGEQIRLNGGARRGDNVRNAGEDIAVGDTVLPVGHRISPADLGLLGSLGFPEVSVYRKLRVAFFSTGDELRSLGEPLGEGEIYDSNRYTLFGMLTRLGVEIIDLGVVRDTPGDVRKAFEDAASCADAIISSGGVSVGEADYVKEILQEIGQIQFWKVAMKPGRPLAFGRVHNACFFGLPGNPVAVMVTFYQFVQPALRRMAGDNAETEPLMRATCHSKLKKKPGRIEYQRGVIERTAEGSLVVHKTGAQGSGILRSMSTANCFIILPDDAETIEPGMEVDVQPFFGLM